VRIKRALFSNHSFVGLACPHSYTEREREQKPGGKLKGPFKQTGFVYFNLIFKNIKKKHIAQFKQTLVFVTMPRSRIYACFCNSIMGFVFNLRRKNKKL
jgi:hypothetical protein